MRVVLFCHSLISDWNHGNAHFLRGIVSEMLGRGFDVLVYEPRNAWSVKNMMREYGDRPIDNFHTAYPKLSSTRYIAKELDLDRVLNGADLVLVHERNEPELIERIGQHRSRNDHYALFFHDTHHRAVTAPEELRSLDLEHYDGVLAFGNVIRDVYLSEGWTNNAWTWHEAADIRAFYPRPRNDRLPVFDLIWIGNWGDEERSEELHEYLIKPVMDLGLRARVHGVRYPADARRALERAGIQYADWLPNFLAPRAFAQARVTIHVPRRPYTERLKGIPTIRPFEALACGIPLVSADWDDSEHLFTWGKDFLVATSGDEMKNVIRHLLTDRKMRHQLAVHGLKTIKERHTCSHRIDELMAIYSEVKTIEKESAIAA